MKSPDIYWQMIVSLLMLAAVGAYDVFTYEGKAYSTFPQLYQHIFLQILIAVGTAGILDLAIKRIKMKQFIFPKSGIITGLLVGMILDLTNPLYAAAVVSAIAIGLKHILVYNRKNIFNPAALGLLISSIFFGSTSTWWVASGPLLIPIIILGLLVALRMRGLYIVVPFLITLESIATVWHYLAYGVLLLDPSSSVVFNSVVIFFAFFMLTEHKTAPHMPVQRVAYGSLIAVFSLVFLYYLPAYFLLAALLVGNVCGIAIERFIKK